MVAQGKVQGVLGKTGRETGPTLHGELYVNDQLVEPRKWRARRFP